MEADAALGRPRTGVVLDPVAGEDLDRAVVHLDREVDRQLFLATAEDPPHVVVEPEDLGRNIELLDRDLKQVAVHGTFCRHILGRRRLHDHDPDSSVETARP